MIKYLHGTNHIMNKEDITMMRVRDIMENNMKIFEKVTGEIAEDILENIRELLNQVFLPKNYEFCVLVELSEEEYWITIISEEKDKSFGEGSKQDIIADISCSFTDLKAEIAYTDREVFYRTILTAVRNNLLQEGKIGDAPDSFIGDKIHNYYLTVKFKVETSDDVSTQSFSESYS